METTQSNRIDKITDVRQSPAWGEMLKFYGWKLYYTSSGIMVAILKIPLLGSMIKVQRPKNVTKQDMEEIMEMCKKHRALFIKIDPFINQDLKIIRDYGFSQSTFPLCPTKTMFINLEEDSDVLWEKISHSGKYSINRARREGAKLNFIRNPSDDKYEEYFKVLSETGKRKHFYVEPLKFNLHKKNCFGTESFLVMVYGKDGKPEGGKFFLAHNKNVLYVTGGTTAAGRKTKSGYLLTWEAILYFKRLGYVNLDLEGLFDKRFASFTSNWEGFTHFKDKFNGEIIELAGPQVKYTNPIMKLLSKLSPIGM